MRHFSEPPRPDSKVLPSNFAPLHAARPMNSTGSLWSDRPLTASIATCVCYAGVFNDVIGVEEMASRLGLVERYAFDVALNELHEQGNIIVQDGFAGLPHLGDQIATKASKIATARRLIQSRLTSIRRVGRNPIVQFVGISGSLAAANPVRDRDNHLDLDIFLITRRTYLWLYRIIFGIRRHLMLWLEPEPALCASYIMDASQLTVMNRNIYTATDIWNLIPVSGFDTYRRFLQANSWVRYYYPGLPAVTAPGEETASAATTPIAETALGRLANKCCFLVYAILRSIKWRDLDILKTASFKTDLHRGTGLELSANPNGGYQALVQKKFGRLAASWFPELLDAELIDKLFPDQLSAEIRNGDIDAAAVSGNPSLVLDFSKYA